MCTNLYRVQNNNNYSLQIIIIFIGPRDTLQFERNCIILYEDPLVAQKTEALLNNTN